MTAGRPVALAGGALALGWLATLAVPPWSDESVGDLGVRRSFAALMLDGWLPYRDFPFEYPPLAAPAILLPAVAGTGGHEYRLGIAALTFALALVAMVLAGEIARRTGVSAWPAMLTVAASPLLLGAVVRLHFDLLPVTLTLAALVAVLARRPALGLALVGVGAMTKGFPLVVAPVALAWLVGSGKRRAAARSAAALAATLAAVAGAWLALSPEGALGSLGYQLDRPPQVESSQAVVLRAASAAGAQDPAVVHSHRSAGLAHPLAGTVGLTFAVALAATVAALSALAARAARRARAGERPTYDPDAGFVLAALAAVATFAATGRVLSPQFLVWVVPLMALAVAWRMWALAAATATACALTLAEFPARYLDLVAGEPAAVAIVSTRNAALLAVVGLAAWSLARGLPLARPDPGSKAPFRPGAGGPARSIGPARAARPR